MGWTFLATFLVSFGSLLMLQSPDALTLATILTVSTTALRDALKSTISAYSGTAK